MTNLHDSDPRPGESGNSDERDERTGITDAPSDIGETTDLAEAERLEEDRARRLADRQPDLPDRAFDRITPQV